MVKIEERKHQKLGGRHSLFISFDYNVDILGILKNCRVYNYDKNTHEWEVPVTELSYLLDSITYLDDIKLVLMQEETQRIDTTLKLKHKTQLFDHQRDAILYGLAKDKWMLLDAPGLGKSLSMIGLAEELKEQVGISHCLIICGINSLKTNWQKEIEKHSNLDSIIIGKKINSRGTVTYTSIKERALQLKNPIKEFFVIVNIESLRDDSVIDAILNSENSYDMMIVDEVHKCKGTSTTQGNNLLKLSAKYMIAMTGTLLMNSPLDALMPLTWIGEEPKRNVTNFKRTFCEFDSVTMGRIVGFKNMDILKDEIEHCSLRRTKDLLNLPEKTIIDEYIEMDDAHKKFYIDVKNGVKEECDKVELNSNTVLSLVTRLRQATSCPSALTTKKVPSSKLEHCCDLVEDIVSNGDKVVIFSNFKEPVRVLSEMLKEYCPLVATGDDKDEIVSQNIDKFQQDDNFKVFIGTIQKVGTGVTLTQASYMIFIDLPWTEALYEQACDRIHRIGSKKPVFIYNLICLSTIDEMVSKLINRKEAISDYIIDNKVDDNTIAMLKRYITDL